jgi:lipopolysaccharide/colanic/teichoic acid biosynthesis glycosyltransferase
MDNQTHDQVQNTKVKTIEENDQKATREQIKQARKEKKRERKERRAVHRMFPIWLRIIVVLVLIFIALIIGLLVGYTVLGGGEEPLEVLTFDFWQHIIDIITGVE